LFPATVQYQQIACSGFCLKIQKVQYRPWTKA
jgi:hypothetical protein